MQTKNKVILYFTNIITYALSVMAFTEIDIEPTKGVILLLLLIPIAVTSLSLAMTVDVGKNGKKKKIITGYPEK